MKHAVLGWGSLLWDKGGCPLPLSFEWVQGGLKMPLEFSRVSRSRNGALTLVIDPVNGSDCPVSFAISSRRDLDDVICDLRSREGTVLRRIGFIDRISGAQRANVHPPVADMIRIWAEERDLSSVVWTDLPSNFQEKVNYPFSVESAERYLRESLEEKGAKKAKEYIERAPKNIWTPLREHLENTEWWTTYGTT